jgi:hypothetical protein
VRKRLEVLRFISGFIRDNKYCPTTREVSAAIGGRTTTTLHIAGLVKNGLLAHIPGQPRTLHLTEAGEYAIWNSPTAHGKAPPVEVPGESDLEPIRTVEDLQRALKRKNGENSYDWLARIGSLARFWKPEETEPLPEHKP